jgi:hypothetical protein
MNLCLCCSNSMLRHFRNHQSYLFCRTCWQEMPPSQEQPVLAIAPLKIELSLLSPALALLAA